MSISKLGFRYGAPNPSEVRDRSVARETEREREMNIERSSVKKSAGV